MGANDCPFPHRVLKCRRPRLNPAEAPSSIFSRTKSLHSRSSIQTSRGCWGVSGSCKTELTVLSSTRPGLRLHGASAHGNRAFGMGLWRCFDWCGCGGSRGQGVGHQAQASPVGCGFSPWLTLLRCSECSQLVVLHQAEINVLNPGTSRPGPNVALSIARLK